MASSSKSEQSYTQASLLAATPLRTDGRGLLEYRPIALETGVAPLANGSARLSIGGVGLSGVGGGLPGTEVLAAVKLEVESVGDGEDVDGGRIVCSVSCSPAAYPNLTNNALDDLQSDLSAVLHQTFAHRTLCPPSLAILPGKKAWLLHLDATVLADGGNVHDALHLATVAALRDTRVPRTRAIEYRARGSGGSGGDSDVHMTDAGSGLDTRYASRATDFELADYWDDGAPLARGEAWPVCVTLNLLPPVHFLDATTLEEDSVPLRLLLFFAFPESGSDSSASSKSQLQGMRLLGRGEADPKLLKQLIQSEVYARDLKRALDAKLTSESLRRNPKSRKKGNKLQA